MFYKLKPYFINFALLSLILMGIAIFCKFIPFGHETLLTVDLGQQYIDFFSLFKETLTKDPTMFLYSFQKAIGGEMLGLWAYYLMSPFNLILLFFNESNFDMAVTLLTYLKIIATGLSFQYFARHKYQLQFPMDTVFSLSYALMSYMVVFVLNIMWLDGLVLLPLIALGLDRSLQQGKSGLYITSLALMLVSNYYIGYMICLFLAMYAIYLISENQVKWNWKQSLGQYLIFIKNSLLAVLSAAVVLIPTLYSITKNKGANLKWEFNLETAHGIQDVLSKMFIGAFNFDEMSSGSPNLYVGALVLVLLGIYFLNRKIKWSDKIIAGLIFLAFFISFRYRIVDRIWHGGQFPIWYHFRFSFTTSFFMVVLAIQSYVKRPQSYNIKKLLAILLSFSGVCIFYLWINAYSFLEPVKILITLVFFITGLIILQAPSPSIRWKEGLLLLLVSVDLAGNAAFILNEMSYVDQSKFRDYTQLLDQAVTGLRHDESDFYRINKTFMRTKNEAMYSHYSGLDHFGSTIEAHVPRLYGHLGLPDGTGFAVYTNGTLFTDDLFNVRYLIDKTANASYYTNDDQYQLYQEATDLDNEAYPIIQEADRYLIRENIDRLGLVMEVSPDIVLESSQFQENLPIQNQELLLRLIDYNGSGQPYFQKQSFDSVEYDHVEVTDQGDGDYYTYANLAGDDQEAKVTLNFTTTDRPYYFTLPSQFSGKNVELKLDGSKYNFYGTFRKRQLTNASYHQMGQHAFSFSLKEDELKANLVHLYSFDEERYQQMIAEKKDQLFKVDHFSNTHISGSIQTNQDQGYLLMTIPYDESWQIQLDGQAVEPLPVLDDTLMAIPVNKGFHRVELSYRPKAVIYGGLTSLAGFVLVGLNALYEKKRCKTFQN
ncbi:YfhO family protein [Hutsoniella sourekii]|uniref:YfhO family protein n=1 Tax=Hutsoniella sourekii TaxID=87650 RepID=UPI0004B5E1DA|nr:YfhO family protein [Hutsoniella sourekii]